MELLPERLHGNYSAITTAPGSHMKEISEKSKELKWCGRKIPDFMGKICRDARATAEFQAKNCPLANFVLHSERLRISFFEFDPADVCILASGGLGGKASY